MQVIRGPDVAERVEAERPEAELYGSIPPLGTSARREATFADLAGQLDPLPDMGAASLPEARRHLNAIRYLDKTLSEIETLRLEQASSN